MNNFSPYSPNSVVVYFQLLLFINNFMTSIFFAVAMLSVFREPVVNKKIILGVIIVAFAMSIVSIDIDGPQGPTGPIVFGGWWGTLVGEVVRIAWLLLLIFIIFGSLKIIPSPIQSIDGSWIVLAVMFGTSILHTIYKIFITAPRLFNPL